MHGEVDVHDVHGEHDALHNWALGGAIRIRGVQEEAK